MDNKKICPSCGAANPADSSYCEQCGVLLEAAVTTTAASNSAAAQPTPAVTDAEPAAVNANSVEQTAASAEPEANAPAGSHTDAPQQPFQPEGSAQTSSYQHQQSGAAPSGNQPPYQQQGYGFAQQPSAAPAGNQPPYQQQGYGFGQQPGAAPADNQPPYQQPGYGFGQQQGEVPYAARPAAPQYPFGQVNRVFGHFDGYFVPGSMTPVRNRVAAAVLCLLLGPFGIHKFYTGQWGWGIVSLFLLITLGWTGWIWGIVYAVALVEAILLFTMSNEDFQNKYHVRAS